MDNVAILDGFTDDINCIVCLPCLESAESAGQLVASAKLGYLVQVPFECEQCGRQLIDGESYDVVLRP